MDWVSPFLLRKMFVKEYDLEMYPVTIQSRPTQLLRWKKLNMEPPLFFFPASHHPLLSWGCRSTAALQGRGHKRRWAASAWSHQACPRAMSKSALHTWCSPGTHLAPSEERGQGSQACRAQSVVPLSSSIDITHMTDAGAPLL